MHEILDGPATEKAKTKFSKRSFKFAMISFTSVLIILFLNYYKIHFYKTFRPSLFARNSYMNFVAGALPILFFITGIIALINSIFSIKNKEPSSYQKGFGIAWSVFVTLILFLLLTAYIFDRLR